MILECSVSRKVFLQHKVCRLGRAEGFEKNSAFPGTTSECLIEPFPMRKSISQKGAWHHMARFAILSFQSKSWQKGGMQFLPHDFYLCLSQLSRADPGLAYAGLKALCCFPWLEKVRNSDTAKEVTQPQRLVGLLCTKPQRPCFPLQLYSFVFA